MPDGFEDEFETEVSADLDGLPELSEPVVLIGFFSLDEFESEFPESGVSVKTSPDVTALAAGIFETDRSESVDPPCVAEESEVVEFERPEVSADFVSGISDTLAGSVFSSDDVSVPDLLEVPEVSLVEELEVSSEPVLEPVSEPVESFTDDVAESVPESPSGFRVCDPVESLFSELAKFVF